MSTVYNLFFAVDLVLWFWFCHGLPVRSWFRKPVFQLLAMAAVCGVWTYCRFFTVDVMFLRALLVLTAGMVLLYDIPIANGVYLGLVFVTILSAGGIVLVYPLKILTGLSFTSDLTFDPMQSLGLEVMKAVCVWLFRKLMPEIQDARLTWVDLVSAVFPFSILLMIYVMSEALVGTAMPLEVRQRIFMFILFAGVLLHVTIAGGALSVVYRRRNDLSRKIQADMQQQMALVKNSEAHEQQIRKLNHDMKNTLLVLRQMPDRENANAYIDRVLGEISPFEHIDITGNLVVDALLNEKRARMNETGLQLKAVADLHCLNGWDPVDLSAIFGNALDNAVEASADVTDPEKKMITFKSYTENGFCVCKISNYYEGEIRRRGDTFLSTKAGDHGIGLQSIRYSVERNGGNLSIENSDGLFTLILLLPVKEK